MIRIALLAVLLAVAACGEAPTTGSAGASPTTSSSPAAKASPSAAAGPKVLFTKSGTGTAKTKIFTTPSEWQLIYTFNCANFGFAGNFIVTLYDGGSILIDLPVNASGKKGGDTIFEHNLSGPYYLDINSECKWTVVVKG